MVKAEKVRLEAQVGGVVKVAWKEVKGVGFYIGDFLDTLGPTSSCRPSGSQIINSFL